MNMTQKINKNRENMIFAFSKVEFPEDLIVKTCLQHREILFHDSDEPALDKGKVKASCYIVEDSFSDKKKGPAKFGKPVGNPNPSMKRPAPHQNNNWTRKENAPEEEETGDFFDDFKGKTDRSQVNKFLKEKKFESLLQETRELSIYLGPLNKETESKVKALGQSQDHIQKTSNTGHEANHQKVEINYGKSDSNEQKSIDKFFEEFDTNTSKVFSITCIFKVNEYLNYPKEEPIWYFYHEAAKSSFGPISSNRLEEMFNHKIINETIPLRFIDLFSHKLAKKPFTYFKLSDVNKPNFVQDIELSSLFYACESIIKNAKRSRLAENSKIQQSNEAEGDMFSDFSSSKTQSQVEKKDKFSKNLKGRPVDANIKGLKQLMSKKKNLSQYTKLKVRRSELECSLRKLTLILTNINKGLLMKAKILEKYNKNCKNAKMNAYTQVINYLNTQEEIDSDDKLEIIRMNFPGNERYNFNSRFINDDMLPLTLSFNEFSKYIREINLMYNNISDDGMVYISKMLIKADNITSLNFMGNKIGDNGCKELVGVLKGKNALFNLNLNSNAFGNIGLMHINELLYTNPELLILDVGGNEYEWKGLISVATALTTTNMTLNILNIDDPRYKIFDQDFFTHFGKMFLLNKGLIKISMKYHKIRFEGIKIMTHYLHENKFLKILDLSGNQIDFQGYMYIAKYLEKTEVLESLILAGNRACDMGAKYFAQGISKNKTLVHVDLTNNDIHNDGLCRISEGLALNTTVKSFRVFWCNYFEDESVRAFKEILETRKEFYPDFEIYMSDSFDLSIAHVEQDLPDDIKGLLI